MIIVIPAYKPDGKMLGLLEELRRSFSDPIVLVDDGGGEAYRSLFDEAKAAYGCAVLVHPENRGKGAAMKTAFQYVKETFGPGETVVTADADGQHLPKDIFACLKEASANPGALVLGSRSFKGNVPARSRVGNAFSRWTFRLLMGQKVFDTQTGLRAFSSDLCDFMLSVPGDRYEYEMQMLCSACRKGIPIREVTIDTVYLEENKSSHFNPLADARKVYGILWKNASSPLFRILSFAVSSVFSWGVDTLVDFLLHTLLSSVTDLGTDALRWCSIIPARLVSSTVNYLINRNVVFRNSEKKWKTALLFASTVAVVLGATIGITSLFENLVFLPLMPDSPNAAHTLSYVLSQVICFPLSYFLQCTVVFPKKKEKDPQ